jgi:hypothetical protein
MYIDQTPTSRNYGMSAIRANETMRHSCGRVFGVAGVVSVSASGAFAVIGTTPLLSVAHPTQIYQEKLN